jgi:putative addiction module component (TIGR02574 family)
MAVSAEKVARDALGLPIVGRAQLVEQLLTSLAGKSDPAIERAHLAEVRRRRAAVRSGRASLVDGNEAHRQVRAALGK